MVQAVTNQTHTNYLDQEKRPVIRLKETPLPSLDNFNNHAPSRPDTPDLLAGSARYFLQLEEVVPMAPSSVKGKALDYLYKKVAMGKGFFTESQKRDQNYNIGSLEAALKKYFNAKNPKDTDGATNSNWIAKMCFTLTKATDLISQANRDGKKLTTKEAFKKIFEKAYSSVQNANYTGEQINSALVPLKNPQSNQFTPVDYKIMAEAFEEFLKKH